MAQYDEERSPLWSIGAVGALGAGAYAGLSKNWRDLLSAAAEKKSNHLAQIEKVVSEIPKFAEPKYTFDFMSSMKGLETSPAMAEPFKEDIAASAYEAIMNGKKAVGHKDAHGVFESIRSASSVDKAYEMAQREISNMGGDANLFSERMSGLFKDGIYNADRANKILSSSGIYEGGGFSAAESKLALSRGNLSSTAADAAKEVEDRLRSILADKGVPYSSPEFFRIGEQEMMRVTVGDPGRAPAFLDLPLRSDVQEMYVGKGLHTRYLTQNAWDFMANGEIKQKKFLQFYLDTLQTEVNKAQGSAGMKRAIRNTIQTVQEKAMKWAPPREFLSSGMAAKEAVIGSQAVFAGDFPSAHVLETAMTRGGMFPVGAPKQVASGVLSTVDWRKKLFGDMSELMPYERNPLQFLRDWTPSSISTGEQGGTYASDLIQNRLSPIAAGPEANELLGNHAAPRLHTVYLKDPEKYQQYLASEMGVMSRRAAILQQWERIKTEKVRLAKGFRLHEAVRSHMAASTPPIGSPQLFDTPVQLTDGDRLGMGERGSYVSVGREAGIRKDLIGYTVTGDNEAILHIKETKHMGKGDMAKFFSFGSPAKHTITVGDPNELMRAMFKGRAGPRDVDVVMPGERISYKKNPYALASQQLEAMEYLAGRRIGSVEGKLADAAAAGDMQRVAAYEKSLSNLRSYVKNPMAYAGLDGGFFNPSRAKAPGDIEKLAMLTQNRLAVTAEKLGFRGSAASEIFGLSDIDIPKMVALAEELGEETLSTRSAGRLQKSIKNSEFVHGSPMLFMGDLSTDLGAGNMARWEPSMLHWLSKTGGKGDLGARLVMDIESRLRPDMVTSSRAAIDELTMMQKSFLGEGGGLFDQALGGFPEAESFSAIQRGGMIREKGYWADLGKNVEGTGRRIYIPGYGAAPSVGPMTTNKGEVLASELEDALYDFQYALRDNSENGAKKAADAVKNLRSIGHAQWASSVSIRERALGTRYMPSQQRPMTTEMAEEAAEVVSRTHWISSRTANKMFEEMYVAAPTTEVKDFIKAQQVAFGRGERIPGLVGRFPALGQYSIQPTFFQLIEELDSPGMRTKALDDIIYTTGATKELSITGLDKAFSKRVSVAQGVGQRLDQDLDFQVASFISDPKTAQSTTRYLAEEAAPEYTEYLGRHYMLGELFKQNAPATVRRGMEEKLAGAAKHYVGQATIGRTNVALDKFRRAVSMESVAAQKTYEPLLWHMEETATIMAKHGGASAATRMADMYEKAITNIEAGNIDVGGKLMTEALETLGGKGERRLQASFAGTGATIDYIFDPSKQGRQLAEMYGAHQQDIAQAVEISKASKSSFVNATRDQMLDQMAMHESRVLADAAQAAVAARAYGAASPGNVVQRLGSGARSRMGAVANVLKRGKGPIALGAAAAAGIMLMSPATSGSISANTNMEGPAGGRNLRPEESIPPGGEGITPPPSGMMISPRTYHQGGTSTRVSMSGSSEDFSGATYEESMAQLRALRGSQMRTRLNVSDSRASLDPNMLADRIYRGM